MNNLTPLELAVIVSAFGFVAWLVSLALRKHIEKSIGPVCKCDDSEQGKACRECENAVHLPRSQP